MTEADRCQQCSSPLRERRLPVAGAPLVKCAGCGLVRTEFGSPAVYDETYYSASRLSSQLEATTSSGSAGIHARLLDRAWATYLDPFSPALARLVLLPVRNRMGGIPPRAMRPGDLLDVGCGDGDFMFRARRCGWNVRGCEVNEAAARSALTAGLKVDLGDVGSLEYQSASFDVVRAWHVLEHVPDPVGLLRQLRPLLRPGGLLILGVPDFGSLARRALGSRWSGLQPQFHISHFDRATLSRALSTADFTILSIRNRSVGTGFSTLSSAQPRLFANPLAWLLLLALDDLADLIGLGDGLEVMAVPRTDLPSTPV